MKALIVLAIASLAILAGCTIDPRNQADADRTRALTEQDVLDRTQARGLQLEQAQALANEKAAAKVRLIRWASIAGSLALAGAILATAAGVSWAAIGSGRAAVRLANVKANLIPLNEQTRQYPLFLQYLGGGRYTLANPNTGSLIELDTRRPEVKQLITAAGAVQLAGVLAREARRSADPGGVAIIQPPIITGGNDD